MDSQSRLAKSENATIAPLIGNVAPADTFPLATKREDAVRRSALRYGRSIASSPSAIGAASIARPMISGSLRLFDGSWVFLAAVLSAYMYKSINPAYRMSPVLFALIGLAAAFGLNSLFGALKVYEFVHLSQLRWQLNRVLLGWIGLILAGLSLGFLTKTSAAFSRIWLATWFGMVSAGLLVGRLTIASLIARWSASHRLRRQIAIVGWGPAAQRFVKESRASCSEDLEIVGIFDDRHTRISPHLDGCDVLGDVDSLIMLARRTIIDEIIIALPCSAAERIEHLVCRLRQLPVDVRLWIDISAQRFAIRSIEFRGGAPVAALADRPLKQWDAVQKRVEDVTLSLVFILTTAPVMILVALAVRLNSRGPVLFKQRRFGFNNNVIEVLKFRTMFVEKCDASGSARTRRNDSRVTQVGRFLRWTSLDELPQLFNVLAGTMSIVGPRPHPLAMRAADQLYHEAVADYFARHRVKPGITGLAQVSGFRGEIDTIEKARGRIRLDLQYIDQWSLALDLRILWHTLWCIVDENAY